MQAEIDAKLGAKAAAGPSARESSALGRKAWLFAGSDRGGERAAVMFTLIQTAKLNGVDPREARLKRAADYFRATFCKGRAF